MSDSMDSENYRTVEVSPNEAHRVRVGPGETLENILFDIEASGATVQITVHGQGWTLRNIGVRGRAAGQPQGQPTILIVPRDNASGLIENCYFGDGSVDGAGTKVFWHNEQPGPITWRRCNIGGFHDNGLYASPTAKMGDDGPIEGTVTHIEDCLFYNNNSWQIKIGSPHGSCTVKNTVFDTSNPDYAAAYEPSAPTDRNLRYLTVQNHPYDDSHTVVDFIDCDFIGDSARYTHEFDIECGCIANLENCRANDVVINQRDGNDGCNPDSPGQVNGTFASNPDPTPPDGVPMTAEEAASGSESKGTQPPEDDDRSSWDEDDENEIHVLSTDGDVAEYEITIEGDVSLGEHADTHDHEYRDTVECEDGVCEIHGYVSTTDEPGDNFHAQGSVDTVDATENTQFLVNGVAVSHEELEGMGRSDDDDDEHDDNDEKPLTTELQVNVKLHISVTGDVESVEVSEEQD